jgi:hypothetical protein
LIALALSSVPARARAQTLTVSANPVVITPPTEAQYDAAPPNNVTAATSITMTLVCPSLGGSTGCAIQLSYTGLSLLVDYQVITPPTGCNSGFSMASFAPVPTTPTTIVSGPKSGICVITVMFRVRGLAYNIQQAGGTILQSLTITGYRQ